MKVCRVCGHCYEDSETICRNADRSPLVADRPGDTMLVGKYRLDRLLGRGGVGAVYAATHVDLEIPVAVKLLNPSLTDDPNALARFRREAQSAARLHHPGIARTHDFGILPDGGAYLVMDLVDGPTLRQMLTDHGPLGVHEATRIARQVLEAIDAAHEAGIIHRDLKPSNIIITVDHRQQQRATVVDFGLAKILEEAMTLQGGLTGTGMFIGTPRYMSPEQCQGEELDPRSDIYSLGVIFYEMLAGKPPFDAPSLTALALKHLQETPPPLRDIRQDLPDDLVRAIEDALEKSPDARPATALALALRFREIETRLAAGDESAQRPTAPGPLPAAATDAKAGAADPASSEENGPATIALQPGAVPEITPRKRSSLVPISIVAGLIFLGLFGWWRIQRDANSSAMVEQQRAPTLEEKDSVVVDDPPEGQITPGESAPGGKATPVATGRPTTRPTTTTKPAAVPAAEPAFDRKATTDSLGAGLSQWIATMNARDVDAHLATYDSRLTAFYRERNVDRARVRREKQQLFAKTTDVSISTGEIKLSIAQDGRSATMRFPKSYTITNGDARRSGEVLSELIWKRTPSGWKIVSERDLRVIR